MQGINIYSGEKGLGGALTNPTELARRKGNVTKQYPVVFNNKRWPDVETAWHALKESHGYSDELMHQLIAEKFRQHPELHEEVAKLGGVSFLEQCSHFTSARTEGFSEWEGQGTESRLIRTLIEGFRQSSQKQVTTLF